VFDAAADSVTGGAAAHDQLRILAAALHADRGVIGQNITIDGARFTDRRRRAQVVHRRHRRATGRSLDSAGMHDVMRPTRRVLRDPFTSWLLLLGRLKPGVTTAQARAELAPLVMRSILANVNAKVASELNAAHLTMYVSSGAKGFSRVRETFEAPLMNPMRISCLRPNIPAGTPL
jgi:hypothetical protein